VLNNGQGSPCIDFRRVPDELAEACAGTDLIIIDGMGRWEQGVFYLAVYLSIHLSTYLPTYLCYLSFIIIDGMGR
jgi:hypothetical protein